MAFACSEPGPSPLAQRTGPEKHHARSRRLPVTSDYALHMLSLALIVQLALSAEPTTPIDAAKRHLAAGKLDDVLFDLDGKTFPVAETPRCRRRARRLG